MAPVPLSLVTHACEIVGDSSLQQHDISSRVASLMTQLSEPARKKMRLGGTSELVAQPHPVGFLQEHATIRFLAAKEILRVNKMDPLVVYRVAQRLLAPREVKAAEDEEGAVGSDAEDESTSPKASPSTCPFCQGSVVDDFAKGRAFHGCASCGAVLGVSLFRGNPYRCFEDREDRRHFEVEPVASEEGLLPLIEQIGGHAGLPYASIEKARDIARGRPRAGAELPTAVAALILATTDYDPATGLLSEKAPPPPLARCATCSAACDSVRSARFHCRAFGILPAAKSRRVR